MLQPKDAIAIGLSSLLLLSACSPESSPSSNISHSSTSKGTISAPSNTPSDTTSTPLESPTPTDVATPMLEVDRLTKDEKDIVGVIMIVNSFADFQTLPITSLRDIDIPILGEYILKDTLNDLQKEIKSKEADKVFSKIAINVEGLTYNGASIPAGFWMITLEGNPKFEEVNNYQAGKFYWDATKVTVDRKITIFTETDSPIEIKSTISYFMTQDGEEKWIILGMEPHEEQ